MIEDERRQVISDGNEKLDSDVFGLPSGSGDFETSIPGSISVSSWATSSPSEDVRSESPIHLPIVPEYFSPDRPIRTLVRHEDIYSILLEHPPRKLVSVGANYQAEIPALDFSGASIRLNVSKAHSDSNIIVEDEIQKRLMGTCIILMPHMESSTYDSEEVGKGRIDCNCEDRGSVRCVRQHIVGAREELTKSNGQEILNELGLYDMGEQVAEKWSAEDEQLFHEYVFNNPSSLVKNFWNNLSTVFPSRTKKEMVSYYFNVFMLRRRAEQNRNDLLNIDSDTDEWQGSVDNEVATQEEDGDSVADFPAYQDNTGLTSCHRNDLDDYDEYAAEETSDVNVILDFTNRDIEDDSKYGLAEISQSSGYLAPIQPQMRCDEVQDGSWTSCDTGVTSREVKMNGDHWPGDQNGVSNGCSQGYDALEACDAKFWDPGFLSCSKNKINFLPTCNMIKEVFGDARRQETRRA